MADVVEIVLALRNVSQFVSGAREASTAIGKVGTESEESGRKAGRGWKGLAKWAGGAAALAASTKFIKDSVGATEDLAKATITLQRTTGMDTETASEWAALTKERGISTRQFQTSLVKLSRTMDTARTGTAKEAATVKGLREQIDQVAAAGGKKAPAQLAKLSAAIARAQGAGERSRKVLAALGVPLEAIRRGSTEQILNRVADALSRMRDPAQRAALMQQVFGRSGQALLPILLKGSKGVRELLDRQKEYGNYLRGKTIKDTKNLIEQQRELEGRWQGTKVQLGTALLPVLIQVGKILVQLSRIIQPLTKNALLFKVALAALVVAFVAWKVATIAATVAQMGLNVAMLPTIGIVAAVVLGIAALIAIGYLLYKNWDRIEALAGRVWGAVLAALQAVWNWVKANWPLLLGILIGPFGLAVGEIIQHFGAIKKFVLGVVDTVRRKIEELVAYVRSLPSKVGGVLMNLPGVKQAAGAFGAGKSLVSKLPFTQHGGIIRQAGSVILGERGPELVGLPRGASVVPLQAPQPADQPAAGGPLRPLEIVVPVILDGRELARSTARVAADRLARR